MRLLLALLFAWALAAEPLSPDLHNDMLYAIYRAEGGAKTRHPYGIKSVRPRDIHHARAIASRMVAQEWDRWHRSGRREPWVNHIARRWCPPQADRVGHGRWISNVNHYLRAANIRAATTR